MDYLLAFALFIFISANYFSTDTTRSSANTIQPPECTLSEEPCGDISIVMEDMISKTDPQDPTDSIIGFRVFDLNSLQQLYQGYSCGSSICYYDLNVLSPGVYYVEADSAKGKQFRGKLGIQ